jgi:hypothetical protein
VDSCSAWDITQESAGSEAALTSVNEQGARIDSAERTPQAGRTKWQGTETRNGSGHRWGA